MRVSPRNIFYFLIFLPNIIFSQFSEEKEFAWPDRFVNYKELPDSLKNSDAVILKEQLEITESSIYRRVAIKILTQKGLDHFKKIQLPENYDLTNTPNFNKQGRFKNRINPYIYTYKGDILTKQILARRITPKQKIIDLPLSFSTKKIFWVNTDGEKFYDDIYDFNFETLQMDDILEYIYEVPVSWNGAQDVIYPNSIYPKLNYNLTITANSWLRADKQDEILIYNTNVNEPNYKSAKQVKGGQRTITNTYHYDYLKKINYAQNIPVGLTLPNISINHGFYSSITSLVTKGYSGRNLNFKTTFYTPKHSYKWVLSIDTLYFSVYDNYHANMSKFLLKFLENKTDTFGMAFLSELIDTLNNLKFLSAESMYYSGEAMYAMPSSEYLIKGKLTEEFMLKNYKDLLARKKIFYYDGIIIDKRRSVINSFYRNHSNLEKAIFLVPHKKAFKYFNPRYNGVKYFLDELPFYYEGTSCALLPCYNCFGNNKNNKILMINTPGSTYNENIRTEAGVFKINPDSLVINVTIKEHLKGQFSTILRHFYNKEAIDSTITENYFKKCVDKPLGYNIQVKQRSNSEIFPFNYSYHCSERINLTKKTTIDLHNWFSFTFKKEDYTEIPTHDFYIDFQYTDVYNFMFEFDKPVEITNTDDLKKNLINDYFEVTSSIIKEEGNNYLLSIIIKVKQSIIPQKDGSKLIEFVNALDEINNFQIQLKH